MTMRSTRTMRTLGILGGTELMLLLDDTNSPRPTFDSTALHAAAAVQ